RAYVVRERIFGRSFGAEIFCIGLLVSSDRKAVFEIGRPVAVFVLKRQKNKIIYPVIITIQRKAEFVHLMAKRKIDAVRCFFYKIFVADLEHQIADVRAV